MVERLIKIFYKNDSDWIIYSIKGDYTSVYKESQDSKIPHSPEMQRIFTQIEQEEPKNSKSNAYIGEISAHALYDQCCGQEDSAITILERLFLKVQSNEVQRRRVKFLIGSGLPTLIITFLTLITYYYNFLSNYMILQEGLYCILYSTLGSLLFHLWTLSDSESTGFSIGLFNFF